VVQLVHDDTLHEPVPVVLPLADVADAHRALEGRWAPAKTVLAI
jgi:hypothetical protein